MEIIDTRINNINISYTTLIDKYKGIIIYNYPLFFEFFKDCSIFYM